MPQEVRFQKGPANTMPTALTPGTISIQTDLGNIFLDVDTSTRIQLKDDTKLPLTGGTLTGNLDMSNNSIININQILDTQGICSISANGGGAGAGGWLFNGTAEIRGLGSQSIRITGNEDSNKVIFSNTTGGGLILTGLTDPIENNDAATKGYVDNMISSGIDASTLAFGTCSSTIGSTNGVIEIAGTSGEIDAYVQVLFTEGYNTTMQTFSINDINYTINNTAPVQIYNAEKGCIGVFRFTSNYAYFYGFINYNNPLDISIDDGYLI